MLFQKKKKRLQNCQFLYSWEMLWPRLFANRDYVLVRKCFIDRIRNLILICCKSTKHPKCPERPHLQRVKDYWSYMVIKPSTSFSQIGFEFILTYFDDPGMKVFHL
jgi:StAR-related lipid transfer protein 7, mitochondrial